MPQKCTHCPLAHRPDVACPAHWDWPGYCGHMAQGHPHWRRSLLARAGLPEPSAISPIPRDPLDPRVRVGVLCPCLLHGGGESWQLALLRHGDRSRIAWQGLCVVGGEVSSVPAMVEATRALTGVTFGREAARDLASRCDVLVTWAIDGLAEILQGLPCQVASVVHASIESEWGQSKYGRPERIDRWVAVSELAEQAIPPASRLVPATVIWNAVDPERLVVGRSREAMRRSWGVPEGAKVAGFLGRLSAEKDPHAMSRLAQAMDGDWQAVVVGAGHEILEPQERLHVVGADPNAGDVLNAFDVLVSPSHYESFGLSMAEAFWLHKPIVSTDAGLAKLVPDSTWTIPFGADGPTLLEACSRGWYFGEPIGTPRVRHRLKPERFGREWTDLLISMAPAPPATPRVRPSVQATRALQLLVRACPHRIAPPCGCSQAPATCMLPGQSGKQVWRTDCEVCPEILAKAGQPSGNSG